MKLCRFLAAVFFAATLIPASPQAQDLKKNQPDPVRLFNLSQNPPDLAYEGHMMITQWSGAETKIEEANIYFKPPNSYRLEFLKPDGTLDRVVMSDGTREKIQLVTRGAVVNEYMNKQLPRLLNNEQEKELIFANYKVALVGEETILGRPTWILELSPTSLGKPLQQIRVDAKTHVILETKKYTVDGSNLSMTRFTRFETKNTMPDALFLAKSSDGGLIDPTNARDFAAGSLLIPVEGYRQTLPGGFALLNTDNFELKGNSIRYLKYTDGLLPLSMFETPIPVKIPAQGINTQNAESLAQAGFTGTTQTHAWNNGQQYYTLMGDIDPRLLEQIASAIKQ